MKIQLTISDDETNRQFVTDYIRSTLGTTSYVDWMARRFGGDSIHRTRSGAYILEISEDDYALAILSGKFDSVVAQVCSEDAQFIGI